MIITDFKVPVLNVNTGENFKITIFPDSWTHINTVDVPSFCNIVCSLTSAQELFNLCLLVDSLARKTVLNLHIPYLACARYDRVIQKGDSFDLRVVAKAINELGMRRVTLYDPHSDVAAALIDNVDIVTNEILVKAYDKPDAVLIIPDAGAAKKAFEYPKWNQNLTSYVQALKHRDPLTGNVTGVEVLNVERCKGRHCVIIDDICDGGRTFIEIAKYIHDAIDEKSLLSLTLIVTHGIFSKGFEELGDYFDQIITSNSMFKTYPENLVKVIEYDFN